MNNFDIRKQREKLGLTQTELAEKIGVSLRTVQNYESGGIIPKTKDEILRKTLSETGFTADAKPVTTSDFMMVPLVHVAAQGSYPKGFGDLEYIETLPTIPVFVDRNYKGKYMIFEVSGDSMDDGGRHSLCDGDKILCREVKKELWWNNKLHIKDWYFVIVCKTEGITVKQITKHDVENGEIYCHPLNPLFEDFVLKVDDIAEIYNVIKIVDRNTRI